MVSLSADDLAIFNHSSALTTDCTKRTEVTISQEDYRTNYSFQTVIRSAVLSEALPAGAIANTTIIASLELAGDEANNEDGTGLVVTLKPVERCYPVHLLLVLMALHLPLAICNCCPCCLLRFAKGVS
jgi:hypothetical protein